MAQDVFDSNVALVEQIGPGVELEVGKSFTFNQMKFGQSETNRAWFRVGGYHYNIQNHSDVYGIQANIEAPLNRHVSLIVQNNYDNQNDNRFSVGLRASFGGSDAPLNTAQSRMMDPIIRHQARQSYGEATPKRLNFVQQNEITLIDNGWFFSPNGTAPRGLATTLSDCTAENPCNTIDSETALRIQQLDPQANLLFETGSYLIPENSPRIANLWDGQSVLGRETGWFNPASGTTRPEVLGGLFWGDASDPNRANSTGYIEHMVVTNNGQLVSGDMSGFGFDSVIAVGSTGHIVVHDTDTSAIFIPSTDVFATAIGIFGDRVDLYGGMHYANAVAANDNRAFSYGVLSNTSAFIENVQIDSIARTTGTLRATARGVRSDGGLEFNGGRIVVTASSNGVDGARTFGIQATQIGPQVLINNATIVADTTINGTGLGIASSIDVFNAVVTNGQFTANTLATGAGETSSRGISSLNNVEVIGGEYFATATSQSGDATAYGVYAEQNAQVNNAYTSGIAESSGSGSASGQGVSTINGDATVFGGTHMGQATSVDGFAAARGIVANQNATVTSADTAGVAESVGLGSAFGRGVRAFNGDANVFGGTHMGQATTVAGNTDARGIQAGQNATVSSADTAGNAESSGAGSANARGVLAESGDVNVSGGTHMGQATSVDGFATASGIDAFQNATVTNADTSGVAESFGTSASSFALGRGVRAFNGDVNVSGGMHIGRSRSFDGVALARGIQSLQNVTVTNADTSGTAESTGIGAATAQGLLSGNGDANVSGGTHVGWAASVDGNASARGIDAFQSATVTNADTSGIAESSGAGSADARGVSANGGDAIVSGGTHMGQATAVDANAIASGIIADQNAMVTNADTSGFAESASNFALWRGVLAANGDANISGGTHTGRATTVDGIAIARGIQASQNATVTNADTSGVAESTGAGSADARGVFAATGDANVLGGTHTAQSASVDGMAEAFGIRAIQDATVTGAEISATANTTGAGNADAIGVNADNEVNVSDSTINAEANTGSGMATATGVDGGGSVNDTVNTSTITVSGNGTNNKCQNVENSDGSCS